MNDFNFRSVSSGVGLERGAGLVYGVGDVDGVLGEGGEELSSVEQGDGGGGLGGDHAQDPLKGVAVQRPHLSANWRVLMRLSVDIVLAAK